MIKRALDIAVSVLLLVLFCWLFALVWLGVACTTGTPALYRHERVGRRGRPFQCLKFRTMVPQGDALLATRLRRSPSARAEWESSFRLHDDPRVTAFGRFLRRYCLDELPQLWNVLVGDMSLVGPRPVTREELAEHYGPAAADYARVRPGLTGPWQVAGRPRSNCSYRDRVRLDMQYIRNGTLRDDLRILLATPRAVLRGMPQPPRAQRPQKIVHVLTRFLRAGSEENTLSTCLAQLAAGHEVMVVHGAAFDARFTAAMERPGLSFHCLPFLVHPMAPLRDVSAVLGLARWLRRERPDVVHTHQSKAGIVGRLAARLAQVPHVIHGIHIAPFDKAGGLRGAFYIALERWAARYTDAFVSVSPQLKALYLRHGIGAANRHFVVHSGMQLSRFVSPPRTLSAQALVGHYPSRPKIVLMLAAYEQRKRHAELLQSFKALARRREGVHLVFAGSGDNQPVHALVQALGLQRRVSVLDHHPQPESLIALADVCILSSRTEGLPRVVVQYLAGGKPVVVSHVDGIESLVRSGHNGFVTRACDLDELVAKVEVLAGDRALLAAFSRAAAKTAVASWDAGRTGRQMAQVYRSLAGAAA